MIVFISFSFIYAQWTKLYSVQFIKYNRCYLPYFSGAIGILKYRASIPSLFSLAKPTETILQMDFYRSFIECFMVESRCNNTNQIRHGSIHTYIHTTVNTSNKIKLNKLNKTNRAATLFENLYPHSHIYVHYIHIRRAENLTLVFQILK